jgi:hypothetical protein
MKGVGDKNTNVPKRFGNSIDKDFRERKISDRS